jgi:phosphopantetheinyl transferase
MPKPAVYFAVVETVDRSARAVLGRKLLMQALSRIVGQKASDYRIMAADSGRPIVVADHPGADGAETGISVSLSHSGNWLAGAATGLGPVGIDIELMRAGRDLAGIADIAFGPEERRRASRDGASGFYRIWTLREAIAKAHGTGLTMAADGHDRVNDGPDEGIWFWDSAQLAHWRLPARLALALAVFPISPQPEIVWERFESDP